MSEHRAEELLHEIEVRREDYRPSQQVQNILESKTLLMIVGPSAIGKSSIMREIIRAPGFGRVTSITTRDQRDDDEPNLYEYRNHTVDSLSQIADDIAARALVQYAVHPTTDRIYASYPENYPQRFNILDTLSREVENLRQLPFKKTQTYCVVAPAQQWLDRLYARHNNDESSSDLQRRLREAQRSLSWALADGHVTWVRNDSDMLSDAVGRIFTHSQGLSTMREADGPALAQGMLECTEALIEDGDE